MPEDSFVLVSLEEEKSKKLAQVISNDTSRKILDKLVGGSATESKLAKELKVPISTIHYNLKQLKEAKLVVADEYTYSSKGKEVLHYKLANKYIIIAPKTEKGMLDRLKQFLPLTVFATGLGMIVYTLNQLHFGNIDAGSTVITSSARNLERANPEAMVLMDAGAISNNEVVCAACNHLPWFVFGLGIGVILGLYVYFMLKKR